MQYKKNDRPALLDNEVKYNVERMSLYTLASQYVYDKGTWNFYSDYIEYHKLPAGTKVLQHYFGSVGLPDWLPSEAEVGGGDGPQQL